MRKRKFLSAALVAAMVLTTTVQTDLAWADVATEETMQNVTVLRSSFFVTFVAK